MNPRRIKGEQAEPAPPRTSQPIGEFVYMAGRHVHLSVISLILGACAVTATASAQTLNYAPSATELVGRAPDQFVHLNKGRFAVVDPLSLRVVIIGTDGGVLGQSEPLPFFPTGVRETNTAVQFTNAGNIATLQRTVDPKAMGELAVTAAGPQPAAPPSLEAARRSRTSLSVRDQSLDTPRLTVNSRAGGYLADASILGRDQQGRIYVQSTEITGARPIAVQVFVQRFAVNGALSDTAAVPVRDMDTVPQRFVALAPDGTVTAIVPTRTELYLQPLQFRGAGRGKSGGGPIPASAPKRIPIQATITIGDTGPLEESPIPAAPLEIPRMTREEIIKRAKGYLQVKWTMEQANFSRPGIESICVKTEGKFWQRPHQFADSVGKEFNFVPYRWGGGDSPDAFLAKLKKNFLAGSICTCRETKFNQCIASFAAGVDCSGLVSHAWGVTKHGTSNLGQVATPLSDLARLRRGDAVNRPGSHVRLVIDIVRTPMLKFVTIESATDRRCEGACELPYTAAQLQGYTPMRYKGVTN
jgi:hypothetical protein